MERASNQGTASVLLGWIAIILATLASGFTQTEASAPLEHRRPKRLIVVSIPDRKLAILEDGLTIRTFPVAVGAASSPSPTGQFEIVSRLTDPTYYHAGVVIPAGSDNPLGGRWVGLNKKGYGIHGTNTPNSIGKAASHGCIRLRNRDIVQFFALVDVGDTVEIHGERDAQIARVFGGDLSTAPTVTPAQTTAGVGGGQ